MKTGVMALKGTKATKKMSTATDFSVQNIIKKRREAQQKA
jgi:hypothetical protein